MAFALNLLYNANLTPFPGGAHPRNAVFWEKLNNSLTPETLADPPGSFVVPDNRDEKRGPAQTPGPLGLKATLHPHNERSFCSAEYTRD